MTDVPVIRVPERQGREEKLFEEIINENLPNLMNTAHQQIKKHNELKEKKSKENYTKAHSNQSV